MMCIKNSVCGSASLVLGKEGVHYNDAHTQMIIKNKKRKLHPKKKDHNKEWLTETKFLYF